MHELSIAVSMIELAEEEAARRGDVQISAIHLKIGALSGVAPEALLSSFEMACEGTSLEGCKLEIERVPVVIDCRKCRERREVKSVYWMYCPVCKEPAADVVQGKELEITAMEIIELEQPA